MEKFRDEREFSQAMSKLVLQNAFPAKTAHMCGATSKKSEFAVLYLLLVVGAARLA